MYPCNLTSTDFDEYVNMKKFTAIATMLILAMGCANVAPINTQTEPPTASLTAESPTSPKAEKVATAKIRSGSFISGEHTTSGKTQVIQENGTYFIELDQNFSTSPNGPDLFVILHKSPNILQISKPPDYAIASGDYVVIAPLKSYNGTQRYEIPKNVQSEQFNSVAIWCRQYNATFGFAPLSKI